MPPLLLAALCALPPATDGEGAEPRPPNVVLILADDLGAGEVGAYGQRRIRTPALDRIAAEGARFTSAYSGSPVCAPSRCVLLTGKHAGHAVVRDNWENGGWGPDEPEGQFPLPAGEVTLAELLRDRGYATCAVGKWGLGGPGTEGHPNAQGFDRFFGYLCQRKAHNYYPTHLWRDRTKVPLEGHDPFPAHERIDEPLASDGAYYARYSREHYAPSLVADEALGWVRAHADGPFFLYYASIVPHLALQAPRDEVEAYPPEWDPEPYLGDAGYLPHPSPRRAYAAMITHLDRQVGRLLDLLDELGLAEDTLVVFTSDNGASWVGGVDAEFFGSHDGRRGRKAQVWEGGLRVPLLVRWPGRVARGLVSDHALSGEDHLATILELVGGGAPAGLDGTSYAPTLLGRPQPAKPYLYWEFRPQGAQAVREGPWKLVRTGLRRGSLAVELYHLGDDPGETTDVAAAHPDVVERLTLRLEAAHVPSPAFPLPTVDPPR